MSGNSIFLGGGGNDNLLSQELLLERANRHGLVAGATGTGKTVTLQIMAEGFSAQGVPVFCADVKGDLSGISQSGTPEHKLHDKLIARAEKIGFEDYGYDAMPTIFWDLYGKKGHPIRATVSEMGPELLARLMDLNETQEGVLIIAFEYADDNGLLLLNLEDLRKVLIHISEIRDEIQREYGNVSPNSVGAIQRRLLVLERDGADQFFGEPALELPDFMRTTNDGRGVISILDATTLINSPKLYSTFLLWLLAELFEQLPEVGDPEKPKLVFFFDEAHLLFDDAPKALLEKIEQVVRLIRSKGVGVFFVTQNPRDLPDSVLAQLGTRIQHALRAYTPSERKAIKAAADSFRANDDFDTQETITQLGTGEALVSTLGEKGAPTVVQRTLIRPPSSRLGPATDAEREAIIQKSPISEKYETAIDRESAYELLKAREEKLEKEEAERLEKEAKEKEKVFKNRKTTRKSNRQSTTEAATKTLARTVAREFAKYIMRGITGGRRR